MGKDLEEINGWFDCHRGEINCLKTREKDAKEENVCRCGCTPSEVGEEFVSSEDEARTELSYASARESKYVAPPFKNPTPIPVPALASSCCLGCSSALPPLEEITEEPTFICDDLDSLMREADEERARDLQQGSYNLVVHLPPQVGSEEWRRLNEIHQMHPEPGRGAQRAAHSCPYLRRDSTSCPRELQGPGEPGGHCQGHSTLSSQHVLRAPS